MIPKLRNVLPALVLLFSVALFFSGQQKASAKSPEVVGTNGGGTGGSGGNPFEPCYKLVSWSPTVGANHTEGNFVPQMNDQNWPTNITGNTYGTSVASGGNVYGTGFGSCSSTGTMTAVFVWDDAGTGQLPPNVAILKKHAVAEWYGESGTANCGLSGAVYTTGANTGKSEKTMYEAKENPGYSFEVQIVSSASAQVSENSTVLPWAFTNITLDVEAYVPRIEIAGVTKVDNKNYLMIGQRIEATVNFGFSTHLPDDSFQWTVDSEGKFSSYSAGNNSAILNTSIDYDSPSLALAFSKPNEHVKIKVQVHQPSFGNLQYPIEVEVAVMAPESPTFTFQIGQFSKVFFSPVDYLRLHNVSVTYPAPNQPGYGEYVRTGSEVLGSLWTSHVKKPSLFAGTGDVLYCQIKVRQNRSYVTTNGSTVEIPGNFALGAVLDGSFPYKAISNNGLFPDNGNVQMESDSPAMPMGPYATSIHMNDGYVTYLMYYPPSNGVGAYYVPLQRYPWVYDASANLTNGAWVVDSNNTITLGAPQEFPPHPLW